MTYLAAAAADWHGGGVGAVSYGHTVEATILSAANRRELAQALEDEARYIHASVLFGLLRFK